MSQYIVLAKSLLPLDGSVGANQRIYLPGEVVDITGEVAANLAPLDAGGLAAVAGLGPDDALAAYSAYVGPTTAAIDASAASLS